MKKNKGTKTYKPPVQFIDWARTTTAPSTKQVTLPSSSVSITHNAVNAVVHTVDVTDMLARLYHGYSTSMLLYLFTAIYCYLPLFTTLYRSLPLFTALYCSLPLFTALYQYLLTFNFRFGGFQSTHSIQQYHERPH